MERNMVKQLKDNHKLILLEIGKMEKEFLKNEIKIIFVYVLINNLFHF